MNPLLSLKQAPTFRPIGSHLLRCRVPTETARQLLKLTRDAALKRDLNQALLDADLHDQLYEGVNLALNTTGFKPYAGAGTVALLCETRDRLLTELDTRVESLRAAGAA